MPIRFACQCGKGYKVADDRAGKRGKCSRCGAVIYVPIVITTPEGRRGGWGLISLIGAISAGLLLGLMGIGVLLHFHPPLRRAMFGLLPRDEPVRHERAHAPKVAAAPAVAPAQVAKAARKVAQAKPAVVGGAVAAAPNRGQPAAAGPAAAAGAAPAQAAGADLELVPDENYRPKVGDTAILYLQRADGEPMHVWTATTPEGVESYLRSPLLTDEFDGRTVRPGFRARFSPGGPESGTKVLVLSVMPRSTIEYHKRTLVSFSAVEVRALDGRFQGSKFFTPDYHLTRMIERPKRPAVRLVRDRARRPAIGDRASLWHDDDEESVWCVRFDNRRFTNFNNIPFIRLQKARALGDEAGVQELDAEGAIALVARGTGVTILDEAVFKPTDVQIPGAFLVAIREGPNKGRIVIVPKDDVAFIVEAPP
jgi:hypothetical protein